MSPDKQPVCPSINASHAQWAWAASSVQPAFSRLRPNQFATWLYNAATDTQKLEEFNA